MKLIDQLLDGVDEAVKQAKKPFIKKRITRAFESAIDSAEEQKVNAELKIHDFRKNLVENPGQAGEILNKIVEQRTTIKKADITLEVINIEKDEWFSDINQKQK